MTEGYINSVLLGSAGTDTKVIYARKAYYYKDVTRINKRR